MAIHGQQFFMGAGFNHFSLIQDNDPVKFKQSENPVGNDKGRFILKVCIEVGNDFFFRPGIHCTQAIIEDDDFMICRPGHGR